MNNDKQFGGALCAGGGTADVAVAAPAEGKKKYVSPTMQVIPLGPQRMLATSGEPPVHVSILGVVDMYSFGCETYLPPEITCDDFRDAKFIYPRLPQNQKIYACDWGGNYCFSGGRKYVKFGPGGEDWNQTDFLANVQFNGGCSFSVDWSSHEWAVDFYPDDRFVDKGWAGLTMISGEYRGRAVEIEFMLSTTGACG